MQNNNTELRVDIDVDEIPDSDTREDDLIQMIDLKNKWKDFLKKMNRDISVKDVQNIILDLTAYAHSSCPAWAIPLVCAIADVLEHILTFQEH